MNIKPLPLVLFIFIAIASAGCLKDSQQPVSHVNDVNLSITGTWTNNSSTFYYYNAANALVYSYNTSRVNLQFDGNKTITETNNANQQIIGNYTITTQGNADYINLTGDGVGAHQYQIVGLQSKTLTLSESLYYLSGITISVNNNNVTYNKQVQVNTYTKNNLPLN